MKMTKKIFIMIFIILLEQSVFASPVKDSVLTTTDRSCAIHYLSHGNTTGWFLTDVGGTCDNGILSGEGSVIIKNAFGHIEEQLIGHFNQGYWTGKEAINQPLKTLLLNHDSEEQFLIYDLGREDRLDIQYLGKMTSTRRSDKTYGPFLSCDPVRVLAVTADTDLFADESVRHNLISSVVQRSRKICSDTMQIQFYAANNDNPKEDDVFFFADIDLETKHIKVKRVPSSSQIRTAVQLKEKTAIDTTTKEKNEDVPLQSPKKTDLTGMKPVPLTSSTENTPLLPTLDADTEIRLDKIPHLLTASRLLKQPVEGRTLIHITSFNEMAEAFSDKPVCLKIKGNGLSLGWGILSGYFTYLYPTGKSDEPRGMVEALSFTPYEVQE